MDKRQEIINDYLLGQVADTSKRKANGAVPADLANEPPDILTGWTY